MAPDEAGELRVAVPGGSIPVRILTSAEPGPRAAIVYFHGGGWVHGGLDESEPVARALADHSGCLVVSVGYRLAPAYRYPTAIEDAWSAVLWVDSHLEEIAGGRLPLIVAGEDAGGNLAAVVARRAASGGPAVALQILIGPITDADFDSLSYLDPASQSHVDRDTMISCWDQYAPDLNSRSDPDASPLQTVFLSGLPPAVILTAEHDVLRDDGELYATRLVQAGVEVEHRRFAGQQHGFFSRPDPAQSASRDGLDYVAAAVARRLAQPKAPRR
ncbi:MAG TPA: alpha/beta hydrolase [Streptosporangiaceae bacterium]|nr:alpha/beta hydrolase [Streptosporangiaceae bacterium]